MHRIIKHHTSPPPASDPSLPASSSDTESTESIFIPPAELAAIRGAESSAKGVGGHIGGGHGGSACHRTTPTCLRHSAKKESGSTRRYGGIGLGLVVSRHLATILNGDLRPREEYVLGSAFDLTLPVDPVLDSAPCDIATEDPLKPHSSKFAPAVVLTQRPSDTALRALLFHLHPIQVTVTSAYLKAVGVETSYISKPDWVSTLRRLQQSYDGRGPDFVDCPGQTASARPEGWSRRYGLASDASRTSANCFAPNRLPLPLQCARDGASWPADLRQ